MGKFLVGLLILILLLGGGVAGAWFYAQNAYAELGPKTADGQPRIVTIPPKASVQTIADTLVAAGALKDDFIFKAEARLLNFGPKLKAGEYAIPSGASMEKIVKQLSDGKVVLHKVPMPEGLTSRMMMRGLLQSSYLAGPLPAVVPAEGVLLPETYSVKRGETRQDVVKNMIEAQQKLIAQLWPNRQNGLPFKTPEEAIVLASIVEKETGNASERPLVAAVFVNRLRQHIPLQSDPTIIYGLTGGEPLGRRLLTSEIHTKTDWNTYEMTGLPKTPICNPGADSIKAVLNPPSSGALYFVADGKGGHVFASTLQEHNANVAAYWKLREANEAAGVNTPAVHKP